MIKLFLSYEKKINLSFYESQGVVKQNKFGYNCQITYKIVFHIRTYNLKMDVPEYGCNENINVKDDDSVVSEKCWKETYRGDSRKWLMRDESRKNSDSRLKSTMKATFSYPFSNVESNHIGTYL